jgi:succinate dehydrogenase / fumarate reductase, cytochrome b subunit
VASVAGSSAPVVPKSAVQGVAPLRAGHGTQFLLRRLHSLSGIVPVGAFLFEHILISNSTAITGPDAYARQVSFLANLPLVPLLELFGIWIPIAFHALYGFYIWYRGEGNLGEYPWTGNWMYTAQRWTGASHLPISSGTPGPCALPGSICTPIPTLLSAKCRWNCSIPRCSRFMWSV